MQPRTLSQIIAELAPTYQPQVDSIRQRQAAIPGQIQAEEQGLGAKKDQAFEDILGGARRRGLGFAGIPLGEQAKYASTEYAPALARLRQSGREQAMSLEDAILGINERQNTTAMGIYQTEQDRAERQRQFDQQMAESRRAAAAAASFSPSFGGGQPTKSGDPARDTAYTSVQKFMKQGRDVALSDYYATLKSAQRGNVMDQYKVQLYEANGIKPAANSGVLANNRNSSRNIRM